MTVAVIGAGVAGLAAAWELSRAGADVTVLESERRPGGVVVTEREGGFVAEGGPDGWLAAEPHIPSLAQELGIAGHIVRQVARGSLLWTGSAFERLEEGRAAALLGIEARLEDVKAGFASFAGGMGELTDALAAPLGGRIKMPLGVTGIAQAGGTWRLAVTGGMVIDADAVVLALPVYSAARLLEAAGVSGARDLAEVAYFPSLSVSLAYQESQIGRGLEGTGYVTPPEADGVIRAVTFASRKFPGRAPAGHVLLRAFLAPVEGEPAVVAHQELRGVLALTGEPLWTRTFFWSRGIPRYPRGHAARVAEVRQRLERLPPLAIAGAGVDGTGVSACVKSGREAAQVVLRRLTFPVPPSPSRWP